MDQPISLHRNTERFLLLLVFCELILATLAVNEIEAGFLGRFSLSTAGEYSDNIRFSEKKEGDFVSIITPGFSLAYKPSWQSTPNFTASLSSSAEFFAQHSNLNNFGDNIMLDTSYFYPYSPRLSFTLTDSLNRHGQSRLDSSDGFTEGSNTGGRNGGGGEGGLGGIGGLGGVTGLGGFGASGGASCGRTGSVSWGSGSTQVSQNAGNLLARGEWLENQIGVNGNFLYTRNLTVRGAYCWDYSAFLDEGGQETAHSIEMEVTYQRSPQNRLHARYTASLIHSRDGQSDIVHDFDLGGDFLKLHEIHLTPTLTVSGSAGIAVLTANGSGNNDGGSDKLRLENKLDADITKIWSAASFTAGVRRGLTGSFGVSGPSFTTSFFGQFTMNFTRRLSGSTGAEYSLYDTGDTKFRTLQAFVGLQYPIANWLTAGLGYSYNQLDPGFGAASNDILDQGKNSSNSVFVSLSMMFDIWPNIGLPRGANGSLAGIPPPSSASRSGHSGIR